MPVLDPPTPTVSPADELLAAIDLLEPPRWEPTNRPPLEPHQIPPSGEWTLWLLEGGRSSGKTEACARYFASYMREHPGARGRIIAPTNGDAVEACVRGPSGLLSIDPDIRFVAASAGGGKVFWPNGSEALLIGTAAPRDVERLRANTNANIDWWEEMAANSQLGAAWDQAALGLRRGRPHSIASTTPRGIPAYQRIRQEPGVARTYATLMDNPHNPPEFVRQMVARFGGTRLGRQELYGELIDDTPGALWERAVFEDSRVTVAPELARVAVAVDPAMTSGTRADDTGIVVCARGIDGYGYVLEDATIHASPEKWAQRVVRAFNRWSADCVVAEVNNGGELVTQVLLAAQANLPIRTVHASRGKVTRAEPVSTLYEQGRVRHVGVFPALEDECCNWVPGMAGSPDRLDALVWGLTELVLGSRSQTAGPLFAEPVHESAWAALRPGQMAGAASWADWWRRRSERRSPSHAAGHSRDTTGTRCVRNHRRGKAKAPRLRGFCVKATTGIEPV
jgi:phage terminase large subunit-like protein